MNRDNLKLSFTSFTRALKIIFAFLVVVLCSPGIFAQESAKTTSVIFKEYYTVQVRAFKSESEAKQLENQMLADQRFFTCTADFKTNTLLISARKDVMIEDIKHYIAPFDLIITNYEEKYSEKIPEEFLKIK